MSGALKMQYGLNGKQWLWPRLLQWSICLFLLLGYGTVQAQEKNLVRQGNQYYQQQKYKEAAAAYQQALQKNPGYVPGSFNLGNSLIQQRQYDAARKVMTNTAKNSKIAGEQSGAHYNIGNTYMQEQKWQEAIDAYKRALRKNAQDADAKYNLSYALTKMKQDQKGGGGKDKNKDKNKDQQQKDQQQKDDQNKDKKDGDKNKDPQNKDPQDGKDPQDKKEDQQHPKPQPSKLSEQQAENLLNALQQDEKKLQDKVQKEKGVPVKVDKDW